MPEETPPQQKTLEMRVAELEDKLSKIHITEEELKAYQKVSSLLGQGTTGLIAGTGLPPQVSLAYLPAYIIRCGIAYQGGSGPMGFGNLGS
jgi:hypothetical protein